MNFRNNYVAVKTFFSIQLGPHNHRSRSHVTIVELSLDVTVWQDRSPYIQSSHFTDPRLIWVEFSPNLVLVLSNDQSTCAFNRASFVKIRATSDDFSILPELIISILVAPCETDVVIYPITGEAFVTSISLKEKSEIKSLKEKKTSAMICSITFEGNAFFSRYNYFNSALHILQMLILLKHRAVSSLLTYTEMLRKIYISGIFSRNYITFDRYDTILLL